MKDKKTAHIISIKWGNRYKHSDVNQLYKMCKNNLHQHNLKFYCFTDNISKLDKNIITHPLPEINLPDAEIKYVYRKEVGLCNDNLGGLKGERVLFLDLDIVITNPIDDFFTFPKTKKDFYIINDWNSKGNKTGQASAYSWQVGTLGYILKDFEKNHKEIIKKYYTASQEYLSAQIIAKKGHLNFWPESWCCSFKQHCLPVWFLRYFITPKAPKSKNLKIIAFHGDPKANLAIEGKWQDFPMPIWKKIYKHVKPCKWIENYLYK